MIAGAFKTLDATARRLRRCSRNQERETIMPQPGSPDSKPARSSGGKPRAAAKSPPKQSNGGSEAKPAKPAATRKPASTVGRTARRTAAPKQQPAASKPAASKGRSSPAIRSKKELDAHIDRVWELAKRIGICMFITWDGERQRARPLVATVEKQNHAVWFLTDVAAHKDEQVEKFPVVALAFADNGGNKYVSITGKAEILDDRSLVKKLWSPYAKAWWKNADDPSIRVIKVTPQDAELWDSPGGLFSKVAMLAAAVTGRGPKIGDNAKVML
jgi:general stress protein 26